MIRELLRVFPAVRRDIRDFLTPLLDLLRMARLFSTNDPLNLRISLLIDGENCVARGA
jgi:hypothetical protein